MIKGEPSDYDGKVHYPYKNYGELLVHQMSIGMKGSKHLISYDSKGDKLDNILRTHRKKA